MALIHVKVTGNDTTGDGSEGNPYLTISKGLNIASIGGLAFRSSADVVLVHYDAVTSFSPLTSAVARRGIPVVGVDSAGIRWDTRAHWSTEVDDTSGLFSRQERPQIDASGGTVGLTFYEWQSFIGLRLNGGDAGTTGFDGSGYREVEIVDCEINDFTGVAAQELEAGSLVIRTRVSGCGSSAFVSIKNVTIAGCTAFGCGGSAAIYNLTAAGALVENCAAILNTSTNIAIYVPNGTVKNSIAVDNAGTYGIQASTYTTSNSYTSNASLYHTTDNYFGGTTPAGCFEVDPLFTDMAEGVLTLTAASPSDLKTGGTTIATALLDVDQLGVEWLDPPSLGIVQYIETGIWASPAYTEGGSIPLISGDFVINTTAAKRQDYIRRVSDIIPQGITTSGPISLRRRDKVYRIRSKKST